MRIRDFIELNELGKRMYSAGSARATRGFLMEDRGRFFIRLCIAGRDVRYSH